MTFSLDDSGLKKLQRNLDALKNQPLVAINDLMTESFVSQHSSFNSFQALVDASGIKYPEEFGNELFSKFIATHTTFGSWDEFKNAAVVEYTKRKLGL